MIAYLLMLLAGAVCFGVACVSRSTVGIVTSGVMLAAMADHAFTAWVPAVVWAGLLMICGVLLAVKLRFQRSACAPTESVNSTGSSPPAALIGVLTALAFPVMAWFVLSSHGGVRSTFVMSPTAAMPPHAHVSGDMLTVAALAVTAALGLALVIVAGIAARQKYSAHSAEAGGMAMMLFGALLPFAPV